MPYEETVEVEEKDELPIMAFLLEGGPDQGTNTPRSNGRSEGTRSETATENGAAPQATGAPLKIVSEKGNEVKIPLNNTNLTRVGQKGVAVAVE